jgi:choline dehydrogenase
MYDYLVIGAGSAGCVVAARLSEDPAAQVCLVEAGPPDTAEEIRVPAAFSTLFKGPLDWDLDTEPEPELNGRRVYLPRGRVLGGSSSLNAMIYIRGNAVDYDWGDGWRYPDVLPVFRRSEDNERGADSFHGVGGPLRVSDSRSMHPLADAFVEAGVQAGLRRNDDFNGADQLGVGRYQVTQRDGLRCSAADAYLRPAADRPNVTVVTEALVHAVTIERGRATGVRVSRGGEVTELHAACEVILCAGSYGSAELLLRSGLGPADELGALGIDVREELPVGRGLQDHVTAMLNFRTDVESLLTAAAPAHVAQLQQEGRGPLTSNVGEAGGFAQTRGGLPGPDVQLHAAPVLFYGEGLGEATTHGFAFGPTVVKPTSAGSVRLRSAAPGVPPRIRHDYLATPEDRASMVAGLRLSLDLARQPALRRVITGPFAVPDSASDGDLLAFARAHGQSIFHPTSSCAIGPVVDDRLRVHGVDRLRVADASVMPTVIRGNTNAAAIMIGERCADLVRAAQTRRENASAA